MPIDKFNITSRSIKQISPQQKTDLHQTLLKTIADIEKRPAQLCESTKILRASLGIDEIDKALDPISGKGIITNSLHEIRVANGLDAASGAGFAICLGLVMAKSTVSGKEPDKKNIPPLFWICDDFTRQEYGNYYGPGISQIGLVPHDLVRIYPSNLEESLWAAGEIAATSGAASFCLMEIRGHPKALDLTATRRLMLRAQSSKTPMIILRQSGGEEASAAATRWHVKPVISRKNPPAASPLMHQFIGPPSFSITLEKCRGANAILNPFIVEWNSNDQCFSLIKTNASIRPGQTSRQYWIEKTVSSPHSIAKGKYA